MGLVIEIEPLADGVDGGHVGEVAKGDIKMESEVLENNFHLFNSLIVFGVEKVDKYIVLSSQILGYFVAIMELKIFYKLF